MFIDTINDLHWQKDLSIPFEIFPDQKSLHMIDTRNLKKPNL